MEKTIMLKAFGELDLKLKARTELLIGGGAAMLLAHGIPLTTMDIDGIVLKSAVTPAELDPLIKKVGQELKIGPHWLNDYISTFTYTVPKGFRERLIKVYEGKNLIVFALGREDLLIMKCFSGREKDVGHARALMKKSVDIKLVRSHLETLRQKGLPGADKALMFLRDIEESV